ncbi:MAG TPA: P-loop NTPase fold protein, partial [Streptosporangiaceae bacterium]|nr:P-loop NTPase fold protein [Streptosporangiaceae bacterium]
TVAFAPDGASIATASGDGTARIWDTRTGSELRQLSGHTGQVRSVAFAPDGATIATSSEDGTARIWDTRSGAELRQLTGHTGVVWSVAFASDGATIATASRDGTARVWDARTGAELRQLTGHTGLVTTVAFAPDGATIATASSDGTARIWDTHTGSELRQLTGHTGEIWSVAFAPDGATLATVSADSTIRIWNIRNGQQVDGTGFGAPRRVGRPLAGVRSDAPSARDEIAATADAETLADLIAASETAPPLAIALIGDWGAGKSSVMLQVQRRIDMLAELSRNNPGLSVFAANVRQVRFNAWDYSDDQVWSGLVDHLFRELAADPADQSTSPSPAEVQARRTAIQEDIAARQAEAQRLADRLSAADNAARPGGSLGWLGSPAGAARIVLISGGLVLRDVRKNPWILLFWAILVSGAYGAWLAWGPRIGAVAAVLAPVVAIGQRLLSWHRRGTGAVLALRSRLDKRQQEIAQELTGLRERLALVDASARLSAFLSDRAAPAAYQRYRGLLGQVRADLTRLADDLTAAHREWAASGAISPPPLERIVLYIDDLDRCPPRRVVEVLEAVHLMLALDLFVVVVAVDARWLIRSMEYHYRELFGPDTKSGTVNSVEAATSPDPASPVDYLDKIFQIPYVLAPSPPAAVASYLQSLLPAPAAPPAAAPEAASSGYSGTEAASDGTAAAAADPQIDGARHAPAAVASEPADRPEPSPPEPEPSPPERDRAERGDRLTGTKDPAASRADSQETAAAAATPDLRPRGLQVSQPEVEFLGRLGPVLPTPRAAKRLVNLYRLVRISIPEADLAAFAGTG